ncbi:hypothetical protein SDC9_117168 [bioreactor metagenome]|uniref:Uncharacterized protein n=1 Tax=bioreactor metagenome TaxID=1076179 RepID=A0A645BY82_9ZZZZ
MQLFPHSLYRSYIQPFRITRSTYIVHMVIQSPSSGTVTFFFSWQTTHIAPIVITQKHNNIIGHTHTFIVIIEYLFIKSPHLRSFLSRLARYILNNLSLIFNNSFKKLHVSTIGHGSITIATHTNSNHIFCILHSFYPLLKELIQHLLVGCIIPRTMLIALSSPFLMIACHWFMMRSTDHHSHFVGSFAVERIITIECPAPHGRP